jgi:hypothetical protein
MCPGMRSFRGVFDRLWHRYLFPFGTFLYCNGTAASGVHHRKENAFRKTMNCGREVNGKYFMNPYSVAYADILYLCAQEGYVARMEELITAGEADAGAAPPRGQSSGGRGRRTSTSWSTGAGTGKNTGSTPV